MVRFSRRCPDNKTSKKFQFQVYACVFDRPIDSAAPRFNHERRSRL